MALEVGASSVVSKLLFGLWSQGDGEPVLPPGAAKRSYARLPGCVCSKPQVQGLPDLSPAQRDRYPC